MLVRSAFNEQNKGSNLLGIFIWSVFDETKSRSEKTEIY